MCRIEICEMQPAVPQLWPLMTTFHTPTFRAAHGCTNTTYQEKLSWHHTPAISTLPRLELDISHLGDYNVIITYNNIFENMLDNIQSIYNLMQSSTYIQSMYNLYDIYIVYI